DERDRTSQRAAAPARTAPNVNRTGCASGTSAFILMLFAHLPCVGRPVSAKSSPATAWSGPFTAVNRCETLEPFGPSALRPAASGMRNKQRLHICATRHLGTRRLEVLAQLVLFDQSTRLNKGILQAFRLPKCDIEKGIAEIGPLGLVAAAERR